MLRHEILLAETKPQGGTYSVAAQYPRYGFNMILP